MKDESLARHVKRIVESLPLHVLLVTAAKTRTPLEVKIAIESGITAIGYNYVQEAETMMQALKEWETEKISNKVLWHLIGHLQRNKARKAVELFDMIETIDSHRIAMAVNNHCAVIGKIMPVLIEINSGQESNKTGVPPDEAISLVRQIAKLPCIKIRGLMTMGPRFGDPEDSRPYFRLTKRLFDRLVEENVPDTEMRYLSMGMSNTYKQAIEEGANIVRIGTKLFGVREKD